MIVFSSYFDALALASLTEHLGSGGYSGPLYNLSIALISANFTPNPQTQFGLLTEANFSGYSRATGLTWGAPIMQSDGTYTVLSQLETFIAQGSSNFTSNVIYGYALIDTSATPNLILCEVFANPVPIALPGDGFGMVIAVNFGNNSGGSAAQVIAAT